MIARLVRRLLSLIPVWIGLSLLAFLLPVLAGGDPARTILERRANAPPSDAEVAALRAQLGLNDPLPVRYLRWLLHAGTGDLGTSFQTGKPVLAELWGRFIVTLELAAPALAIALVLALTLGAASAVWRNSPVDHASRLLALAGASMPMFWLGYLLILTFSVKLRLLPVAGRGGITHLLLPAATLAIGSAASLARFTRSSLLEVLGEGYVRTARAMGLRERTVLLRFAFKNALVPIITVAGLRLGHLLAGAVIVEVIFAWPGLGSYVVSAVYDRDYPAIQGFVIFVGTVFFAVNLLVDMLYVALDPRIRLAARE